MNGGDSLETSFWIMVLVQTIGSVDMPGRGARKMPAPRSYVAIVVTWIVLFFAAGIGPQARRGATAVAWLLVLAGLVIGPFGQRVISLFNTISSNFPTAGAVTQPTAAQTANAPAATAAATSAGTTTLDAVTSLL